MTTAGHFAFLKCHFLGVLSFSLVACTSQLPRIPVEGELGGQRIITTVDSEIARYCLEQYLKGNNSKPEWHLNSTEFIPNASDLPTREYLKKLCEDFSVDFAALYLGNQILARPNNRAMQSVFEREIDNVGGASHTGEARSHPRHSKYLVFFVPTWDYEKSGGETGADFAKPRRVLLKQRAEFIKRLEFPVDLGHLHQS